VASTTPRGTTLTLVDGAPADALPLDDRALHYGDGLFETIAVHEAEPRLLRAHLERLLHGCARLGLPPPAAAILERELRDAASRLGEGVLKLIVTRGGGERGYRPPRDPRPRRVLLGYDLPAHARAPHAEGLRVRLCATRVSRNRALAGLKHLNRLEQVLARAEWDDPAIAEGLMLDDEGNVTGGASSNLFAVLDGALVTPRVDEAGVAGVMRRTVMEIAPRAGFEVRETTLHVTQLRRATELMLSSSLIGLRRVQQMDEHVFGGEEVWHRLSAVLAGAGVVPR
jgi:4-amino-4-deoxychorismate lyase